MGVDYSCLGMVGVKVNQLLKKKTTYETVVKYNVNTGVPYDTKVETEKTYWLGNLIEDSYIEDLAEKIGLEHFSCYGFNEEEYVGLEIFNLSENREHGKSMNLDDFASIFNKVKEKLDKTGYDYGKIAFYFNMNAG